MYVCVAGGLVECGTKAPTASVTEAGFSPGAVGLVLEPSAAFGAGALLVPCLLEVTASLAVIFLVSAWIGDQSLQLT